MRTPKFILFCFSFLFLFGKSSAQVEASSIDKFSMGLGIDIESIFNNSYYEPTANVTLNFDFFKSFRLETEIGYQKSDRYNESDRLMGSSKTIGAGLGGYWLLKLNNVTPYVGLRYYKSKYDYTYDDLQGNQFESHNKQSSFGPILGVEYRFVRNFSLGAEFGYIYMKSNNHYISPNSNEKSSEKSNQTSNSIKFRFFFF